MRVKVGREWRDCGPRRVESWNVWMSLRGFGYPDGERHSTHHRDWDGDERRSDDTLLQNNDPNPGLTSVVG